MSEPSLSVLLRKARQEQEDAQHIVWHMTSRTSEREREIAETELSRRADVVRWLVQQQVTAKARA